MRVPLESYLKGPATKVFSLVVGIPFSPLDIDLFHMARGEWNAQTDRFRVWHLPGEGNGDVTTCYLMIRKFDPQDKVVLYCHVVLNCDGNPRGNSSWNFVAGILSNDEVRARSMLNSMLGIPPSFHRRSDVKLIERRWRTDPQAAMRFLANVHSVLMSLEPNPSGKVYALKFDPPPGLIGELKRGMGGWWHQ